MLIFEFLSLPLDFPLDFTMSAKRSQKRKRASTGSEKKRVKRDAQEEKEVEVPDEEVDDEVPILVEPGKGRRYKAVDWKDERYHPGEHVIVKENDREWIARIDRVWANRNGLAFFQYTQYWRPVDIRERYPGFDLPLTKHHEVHECFVTDETVKAQVDIIKRKALVLNWADFRKVYSGMTRHGRKKLTDVFFCTRILFLQPPKLKTLGSTLFPGDQLSAELLRKAGLPSNYYEQRNIVDDEDPTQQRYNSTSSTSVGVSII